MVSWGALDVDLAPKAAMHDAERTVAQSEPGERELQQYIHCDAYPHNDSALGSTLEGSPSEAAEGALGEVTMG